MTTKSGYLLFLLLVFFYPTSIIFADSDVGMDSHSNNDLKEYGVVEKVEGKIGFAADFEKDDNDSLFIEDSIQNDLDISGNMSISGWFKFEHELTTNEYWGIVFKDAGQPERSYGYFVRDVNGQNGIGMYNSEDGTNSNTTNNKLVSYTDGFISDKWYFIVWVFDASVGQMEAFIDGQSIGVVGGLRNYTNDSDANFKVSGWQDGFGGYYDGLIDELGVWNKALSNQEILSLYGGGSGIDYSNITDKTGLVSYWSFEGEPIEKSYEDLVGELIEKVETEVAEKPLYQSYIAHVKNLLPFHEKFNLEAARNQIKVLLDKFTRDVEKSDLEASLGEDLIDLGTQIDEALKEEMSQSQGVPLMTQIASPYSPGSEDWADDSYAGSGPYWCGTTIGECGCAISSLSMLALHHGLATGLDGSEINPGNLNSWLQTNDGYSASGGVIWNYALQYFSPKVGFSNLSFEHHNATDKSLIDDYVNDGQLAIAFKASKGHYFVLTDLLANGGYGVNDPLWYETKTTDDTKDIAGHVQDYDNTVDSANLFTFTKNLRPLPSWVEIHLGSPAELLLTDSQNRRTGYDPETGEILTEIPGSSYVQAEGVFSKDELGEAHLEKVLMVRGLEVADYSLDVIGTGNGEYALSIANSGGMGQYEIEHHFAEITNTEIDNYLIAVDLVDPDSGHGNEEGCDVDNPGESCVN